MFVVPRRWRVASSPYLLVFLAFFSSSVVQAGTIVRISTTMGDYSLELLDEMTPATVQNFLNYVNRNAYNGTYYHRVVGDFVVQGGGFTFQAFEGPIPVPADPAVINEFGVSNTRGTVAMAKLGDDPNSATSQWFVNLGDNSANLDSQNEGFTVFATVLGDGLAVLDAIGSLSTIELGPYGGDVVAYTTEFYEGPSGFVYMNAEVVERFSSAPHVIESGTGTMITSISVDDGAAIVSMNFNLVSSEPDVVLQANTESVITRRDSFVGIATYSSVDERLRIPSLEVNLDGSVSILNNVVFRVSNLELGQFTLESYDQ